MSIAPTIASSTEQASAWYQNVAPQERVGGAPRFKLLEGPIELVYDPDEAPVAVVRASQEEIDLF
jgi:hypothetical protein